MEILDLEELKENKSEVIDENNSLSVIVCNSKSNGGFKSFKTYKSAVYNEYISEKYNEFVLNKVKSAKVKKLEKFKYVK